MKRLIAVLFFASCAALAQDQTLFLEATPGNPPTVKTLSQHTFSADQDFDIEVTARTLTAAEPYVAEPISLIHDGADFIHLHLNRYQEKNPVLYADYNQQTGDVIAPSRIPTDTRFHTFRLENKSGKLRFLIDGEELTRWDRIGGPSLSPQKPYKLVALVVSWSDQPAKLEIRNIKINK